MVDHLVAYYASLVGRKHIPDNTFGQQPILFKMSRPLTKPELLYAIETTLALHYRLRIIRTDDKVVRLERLE